MANKKHMPRKSKKVKKLPVEIGREGAGSWVPGSSRFPDLGSSKKTFGK